VINETKLTRRDFLATSIATTSGLFISHHQKAKAKSFKTKDLPLTGLPTGYLQLDELTGGLQRGELVILASWPSMGKTSLALNITDYVAIEASTPALYVSLGTSQLEITERLMCARGEVCRKALLHRALPTDIGQRLIQAGEELTNSPFYIDDRPLRTTEDIAEIAGRLNDRLLPKNTLGLLVVDHLQRVETMHRRETLNEHFIDIAYELKNLAHEMNVAVLCLLQLNRCPADINKSGPSLSELFGTQYAADVALLLHRPGSGVIPNDIQESPIESNAKLSLIKRSSCLFETIDLTWNSQYTRFTDPPISY
jgi:replicative DNA helicase